MLLDTQLHRSPCAIHLFVKVAGTRLAQVSNYVTDVGAFLAHFHLHYYALAVLPWASLIFEAMIEPYWPFCSLVLFLGSLYCGLREFIQCAVARQARNKMYLSLSLAPVHQLVATEMPIPTNNYQRIRPLAAQPLY